MSTMFVILSKVKDLFPLMVCCLITLPGCFSSTSNDKKEEDQTLKILWEYGYQPVSPAEFEPNLVGDRIHISGDLFLTALDVNTGQEIWKESIPSQRHIRTKNLSFTETHIFSIILRNTPPPAREAIAFDRDTGSILWNRAFEDSIQLKQIVYNTTLNGRYVATADSGKIGIISSDGSLYRVIDVGNSPTNVVLSDGVLYVSHAFSEKNMATGQITAIDAGSWEKTWEHQSQYGWISRMRPLLDDGNVYVGTTEGYASQRGTSAFFALNSESGQQLWLREGIQAFSAVLNGDFIYINDSGGIHKLRKDNGKTVWHTNFGSSGTAPIAYGYGHVYAPHSGAMRILNALSGEIVHIMSPPDGSYFWKVTAAEGRIFAQSNSHLYAFAPWGHEEAIE